MKNSIKIVLVLILVIIAGCSSNDDEPKPESNLLIGVWKPIKFVYVCTDLNDEEFSTACEQTGRLTMRSNGTWTETYFYEYNNVCEDDGESSGTWKIVNGKLIVSENGSDDIEITLFEISETTLKIGQYDEEFCEGNDAGAHYYGEYIRVN
ncbi:lipocalin-like domain-containing protein [Gaetbulibacter saemankumensis]|uniref:lipocalin family protein n=1 Tax=Gaetbulibacter saemankumensis TaxID=311208 RepID=UPI000429F7B8|nr:lipocalin family protein [Gaetbulibacter saemankumensis]